MEEQNINFDYSSCIKEYDNWGSANYVNICTQETTTVPWGVWDYIGIGTVIIIGALFITLIGCLIKMMFDY